MTHQPNNITNLSIKGLLDSNDKYVIPIYQRNYAWGEGEITQLIQDIIDYCTLNNDNNYYLGTLVTYERETSNRIVYETIDGQQRLTTLSILVCVIKNKYKDIDLKWFERLNLIFDSRKISTDTLTAVHSGHFPNNNIFNESIKDGYELIEKILPNKLVENKLSINLFCDYLFEKVKILRVPVPSDTDLNHYFEIMNNRGEQLEKHEILKSKLLEILNKTSEVNRELNSNWFNVIWEACSNMEKYVQYGFNTDQRNSIFGHDDWNTLKVRNFDDVCLNSKLVGEQKENESTKLPLSDIIAGKTIFKPIQIQEENPDRFNSVINFPNFLLHVLRIQTKKDVPLDDKRLLKIFYEEISETSDEILFVKEFAFNLLKCKLLFDKYIIKREFIAGKDNWSLKKLKWYAGNKISYVNTFGEEENDTDENRTLLMLLSMFHVSTPTMVYKHWLNAALNYLFDQYEIKSNFYSKYLEELANAFVFDRFLAIQSKDYFEIIYKNLGAQKNTRDEIDLSNLTFGRLQNNLIFNYLDFLLWQNNSGLNPKIKNFEFTFRSSVEHYYPQQPMQGFTPLREDDLDNFGNLCLISSSKNSRLSNFMPTAKKEYYAAQSTIDSIKQYIMMYEYNPELWNTKYIKDHNDKMINLLLKQINTNKETPTIEGYDFIAPLIEQNKGLIWFETFKETNKVLLIRTLMCFGRIDFEIGWTSGGGKWNFYQWERIKESEAFAKYIEYVLTNIPESLTKIIEVQLIDNKELREDSYRYVFVSRPEILEYCLEGNFGWINDGRKIILMEGSRASLYKSCDLYTFLLCKHLSNEHNVSSYCGSDRLKITLKENDGRFELVNLNFKEDVIFEIWNNGNGQICYEINTRNLHGNSKVYRKLKESGWEYNTAGRFYYTQQPIIVEIGDDIETNIIESMNEFNILINLLKRLN